MSISPPQGFGAGTGESTTASNVGGEKEVFKALAVSNLEFRTLKEGTNITIIQNANNLEISSLDTGEANTASNVGTGEGVFKQKTGVDLEFLKLLAGTGIDVATVSNDIVISLSDEVFTSALKTKLDGIEALAEVNPLDISCKIIKTSDQSISNNTMTTINWNSELYDTDGMHDNSTNNSRITIKTAGKYSILAQSEWGANSGGFRFLEIIKNGVDSIARVRHLAENASEHNISFVGEFAVNDYIELIVFQDTGGNLDFESGTILENTYLEAHKIA